MEFGILQTIADFLKSTGSLSPSAPKCISGVRGKVLPRTPRFCRSTGAKNGSLLTGCFTFLVHSPRKVASSTRSSSSEYLQNRFDLTTSLPVTQHSSIPLSLYLCCLLSILSVYLSCHRTNLPESALENVGLNTSNLPHALEACFSRILHSRSSVALSTASAFPCAFAQLLCFRAKQKSELRERLALVYAMIM